MRVGVNCGVEVGVLVFGLVTVEVDVGFFEDAVAGPNNCVPL